MYGLTPDPDHRFHPTTKPNLSAAHHARYFRKVYEGICQEETRTVRTIV